MADKAIDVGLELAKWGGAAIAGVATYGVAHLNNELEQTQISLAAIGQAQGYVGSFERAACSWRPGPGRQDEAGRQGAPGPTSASCPTS